jgi:cytochrome c peroxidase
MDRPSPDIGQEAVRKDPKDRGRFKTPSLRNVALTWPYNGSLRTLADVAELYDRGGVPNPTLDVFVFPLDLSGQERWDLGAFLEALTGTLPASQRSVLPE